MIKGFKKVALGNGLAHCRTVETVFCVCRGENGQGWGVPGGSLFGERAKGTRAELTTAITFRVAGLCE